MHRADIEWCQKHGNPSNPNSGSFFGPVSVAELKRNAASADEVIKQRRLTKNEKVELKKQENLIEVHIANKENEVEKELNRTFEIDDNMTELDEKLVSFNITCKPEVLDDSRLPPYVAQNRLKDISNSNANKKRGKMFNPSPFLSPATKHQQKVAEIKKGSCLIDETFNETMKAKLTTPLIDRYAMSRESPIKRGSPLSKEEITLVTTPRIVRMSDTFINDLLPDNILINTTIDENDQAQSQINHPTPDIFNEKRNNSWKNVSSGQRLLPSSAVKSKLPKIKKTPIKDRFLFVNSPVADYIKKGTSVKSLSKERHIHCIERYSKSDPKLSQPCKIPVSTFATAKRKLNLNDTKPLNQTLMKK